MMDGMEIEPGMSGGALVAQGFALMRYENESMLQIAVQRPRDERKIIEASLLELELVPEQAKAAFYEIPYQETLPDGTRRTVKVSGPSIKAAMSLARRWGNCTVTARVLSEDLDGFNLEGIYLDLESNFRVSRPMRVGKSFRTRSRKIVELDPKRLEMAIQAGASKAIRNATLGGLPAYLVAAYDQRAREITGGKLDATADPKTVQAVIRAFAKMKITTAQLEQYADDLPMTEWTGNEVASLRGLWNALNDGQMTAAEAFPPVTEPLDSTVDGKSSVTTLTPDSLLGGTVTGQNDVPIGSPLNSTVTSDVMADDPPMLDVDAKGIVTAPWIQVLQQRADAHHRPLLVKRIEEEAATMSFGRYEYWWVEVARQTAKTAVPTAASTEDV